MMRKLFVLLFIASTAAADPSTISGPVTRVIDGDTIEVNGHRIRLEGIAAPELKQPGGVDAWRAMQAVTFGELTCRLTGAKSYNRDVAVCERAGGGDLGGLMVAMGWARDCPRYSGGRYAYLETGRNRALPLPSYCAP